MSVHDGSDENDGRLTGEGVDQVDEMKIFVLKRYEEVVLKQSRYGLISISMRKLASFPIAESREFRNLLA